MISPSKVESPAYFVLLVELQSDTTGYNQALVQSLTADQRIQIQNIIHYTEKRKQEKGTDRRHRSSLFLICRFRIDEDSGGQWIQYLSIDPRRPSLTVEAMSSSCLQCFFPPPSLSSFVTCVWVSLLFFGKKGYHPLFWYRLTRRRALPRQTRLAREKNKEINSFFLISPCPLMINSASTSRMLRRGSHTSTCVLLTDNYLRRLLAGRSDVCHFFHKQSNTFMPVERSFNQMKIFRSAERGPFKCWSDRGDCFFRACRMPIDHCHAGQHRCPWERNFPDRLNRFRPWWPREGNSFDQRLTTEAPLPNGWPRPNEI